MVPGDAVRLSPVVRGQVSLLADMHGRASFSGRIERGQLAIVVATTRTGWTMLLTSGGDLGWVAIQELLARVAP